MKLPRFGYCAVTADILHIGHINFIKKCKSKCEHLIVGIMSDECVKKYKGKIPVINEKERALIIGSLKDVYKIYCQNTFDFPHYVFRLKDIYGKDFIVFDCEEHKRKGADLYFKRTKGISSTDIKRKICES